MTERIKIGFVPSFRARANEWNQQMRVDSLAAFETVRGIEVVVPQPSPDGESLDAAAGYTPYGCVRTLEQAAVVAAYFRRKGVQGLILCPLDFGDERSAAKVAEALRVPTLLYATKEPPAPADDPGLGRVSDSYCGNLSMASALYRRHIPFHFGGLFFPDEPAFAAMVQDFARAVAVVVGLRGAQIGQVGTRPAPFETVAYDEVALMNAFDQNVIPVNLGDMVAEAQSLADDDPAVQAALTDCQAQFGAITVGEGALLRMAKLEAALTAFWQANRLSAMAVQCWSAVQRTMGISVCALLGRLTGQRMPTACEADVLGAVTMLINDRAALGETVPHFIDWTIRHRTDPNMFLAWHCGNAPACLARDRSEAALRPRNNMTGALPLDEDNAWTGLAHFQLKPGAVTITRLAQYDGHWKLLIAAGEIVPSDEVLGGTWSWVRVRDHERLYRTLVEEGFIHHASLVHGDQRQALLQACKFLDIQPVVVD